ncbi:MAG: hypothetical protein C0467_30610 [Planctomycetaceae bacterium]|nr:hypothetical protein [Planctomycetaceae bacterium]
MSNTWPAPADAAAIFQRLLAGGDPVAKSDFAVAFLDLLVAFLRATHPHEDDHALFTAAEDALLSVMNKPSVFDPTRGTDLAAFLRMAASADLKNLRDKEWRRRKHHEHRDCVELPDDDGNSSAEDATELASFDDPALAEVIAAFTEAERIVFELMRTGERRTEVFAAALGLGNEPLESQERHIKRLKDRIKQRLKRAGGKA